MAQMKERIRTPEKYLSDKEIDNLSDAQFKTLVIKMLTEWVEYGGKIGEVKSVQSKIKKNIQEPTVKGRKLGLKSTIWSRRKKLTFNQNRMKKQEFKKKKKWGGA